VNLKHDAQKIPTRPRSIWPQTGDQQTKPELLKFRYDVLSGNSQVLDHYEEYIERLPLNGHDTRTLIARLSEHFHHSRASALENPEGGQSLQRLLGHYQAGRLPHDPFATSYLMTLCGKYGDFQTVLQLLSWAESQRSDTIGPVAYGEVIRQAVLLSAGLEVCEDLYQRAMATSSNAFAKYLGSPNAVLQFPERKFTGQGIDTKLLNAIAVARFAYGDWREAYMAIDTALKMYPETLQDAVVKDVILHRPLEEALRMHSLHCMGGGRVGGRCLWRLFGSMRSVQGTLLSARSDNTASVLTVSNAQIDLLHTTVATGQLIPPDLVRMFVLGMLANLPRRHDSLKPDDQLKFHQQTLDLKDAVLKLFAIMGLPPVSCGFVMVRVAKLLGNKQLFQDSLEAWVQSDTPIPDDDINESLAWAMSFGDPAMLQAVWNKIQDSDKLKNAGIDVIRLVIRSRSEAELNALSALSIEGNRVTALRDQLAKRLSEATLQKTRKSAYKAHHGPENREDALKLQEERINKLIDRLHRLSSMIQNSSILNVRSNPPAVPSLCPAACQYPSEWHARLYKEMHLDPLLRNEESIEYEGPSNLNNTKGSSTSRKPNAAIDLSRPASTRTGFSYSEVRLRNFQGINDILMLADAWTRQEAELIAERSAKNTSPVQRLNSIAADDRLRLTEEEWRSRILFLRGVSPTTGPKQSVSSSTA
jgi:tetratricopeptide (TPR) repeat protein